MSFKYRPGLVQGILLLVLIIPGIARSTSIIKVDRAIHDGFELLIIHCDSLPEFSLDYDRVTGVSHLRLRKGTIGKSATHTINNLRSGITIRDALADAQHGQITFRTNRPVYIRQYLVAGPPALILDFGSSEELKERLPFELEREDYLRLGSNAERDGKLEIALGYVEHVREWEGSDVALTHRAGVIEQRLGRWDEALETLGESARIAEFAADAHARRTMIFLAKGDTTAMGDEWAGFFHKSDKKQVLEPEVATDISETVQTPLETANDENQATPKLTQKLRKKPFEFPRILRAGGSDSSNYLLYGWGFLGIGLVSLIGLLIGSSRKPLTERYYPSVDISVPTENEKTVGREDFQDILRQAGQARPAVAAVTQPTNGFPKVMAQYASNSLTGTNTSGKGGVGRSSSVVRNNTGSKNNRVPVDEIVSLAESGLSEGDIAHKLMVGRDEVAMVLNLARMARRNRTVQGH